MLTYYSAWTKADKLGAWNISYHYNINLKSTQTNDLLIMYFCLILTIWMDTGNVVATYYPKQFNHVIY